MITITDRLAQTQNRINLTAAKFNRNPQSISLLAVSKTKPSSDIITAYQAGQRNFGENYVQEGVSKVIALHQQCPDAVWHYIGPLQSNKTKEVAEQFDWMHTLDRLKIAQRLNNQRPETKSALQVCIQVNISGEASKAGISLDEVETLSSEIQQLPNLCLRGLMAIPSHPDDEQQLKNEYHQMQMLFEKLKQQYDSVDTLSMGMSQDLEMAVEHGTTMVRIGSAIFGARHKPL